MKTIPADVWDALEMSAMAAGGIGAGRHIDWDSDSPWDGAPFCIEGHVEFLVRDDSALFSLRGAIRGWEGGSVTGPNDCAVRAINRRKRSKDIDARVSWDEYVAERGWVREGAA